MVILATLTVVNTLVIIVTLVIVKLRFDIKLQYRDHYKRSSVKAFTVTQTISLNKTYVFLMLAEVTKVTCTIVSISVYYGKHVDQ